MKGVRRDWPSLHDQKGIHQLGEARWELGKEIEVEVNQEEDSERIGTRGGYSVVQGKPGRFITRH